MKIAVAIRHVAFEDLGTFEPVLAEAGYAVRYVDAASGLPSLGSADEKALLAANLLAVLGGPIGAYEEESYPFLADELRLVDRRLAAGRPLLGICLGAQVIARSLGARVYPGPVKEIGWAPLGLTADGSGSCLRHVESDLPVLHWHGDTFDLPQGATRLASSRHYQNQAFSHGAALALQFHLEADPAGLERWFIGHAAEIAATPGIDVPMLRRDSHRYGPALATAAAKVLAQWLGQGQA